MQFCSQSNGLNWISVKFYFCRYRNARKHYVKIMPRNYLHQSCVGLIHRGVKSTINKSVFINRFTYFCHEKQLVGLFFLSRIINSYTFTLKYSRCVYICSNNSFTYTSNVFVFLVCKFFPVPSDCLTPIKTVGVGQWRRSRPLDADSRTVERIKNQLKGNTEWQEDPDASIQGTHTVKFVISWKKFIWNF